MRHPLSFNRCRLRISAVVLVALLGLFGATRHLRLNTTESAPKGLYLVLPGNPVPGSWVAVCLPPGLARFSRERGYVPSGNCPSGTAPLLKRLAAAPGDRIELAPAGLSVNGRRLAGSSPRSRDSRGRLLPLPPYGTYQVGREELWLASPLAQSWDSRYFGPLDRQGLLGVAYPLLVESQQP